jgi:endonuclease YncB( thermonuclease family)
MPAPKVNPLKHVYEMVVVKVKDGDTIDASIRMKRSRLRNQDLGFHVYVEDGWIVIHDAIRFFGTNANEHDTAAGDEATKFLKTLIKPGDVIRVATKVVKDKDTKEKYGRWLGTLWRVGDDKSINDQMVAAGHAKPWDGKGAKPV